MEVFLPMKYTPLLLCLFLISCTSPEKSETKPETYIQSITQSEFSTKQEYGEFVKDSLEYQYTETFLPNGALDKSITSFGYSEALESNTWLYDTLQYRSEVKKNHIDYFIDDELSEKEVKKGRWMYVYDVNNPEIPMLIRQHDSIGNILLEAAIDERSIYQREFKILKKDKNGYATLCLATWKELKPNNETDLNNYSSQGLITIDSTTFIDEFNYVLVKQ